MYFRITADNDDYKTKCEYCGRVFKSKQMLNIHKNIHLSDEEKYSTYCKICKIEF